MAGFGELVIVLSSRKLGPLSAMQCDLGEEFNRKRENVGRRSSRLGLWSPPR